ncbi:MAG: alpha/beta fold hydrolase [Candidatus Hydrogenedens sp.]|jgi:esterase/lipase|nr:alpha/beta fold hydrolase [Candidatus Hydrogenedens sp.]
MAAVRIIAVILVIALVTGALIFWNSFATRQAARLDESLDRDPETGILLGAEPRTLGPANTNRAVLFVHGFIATPNSFADLPDLVAARGWHVRVMLLPGHGTSPFDFEKTTVRELEEAVTKELLALQKDYKTVVILGHSMGGALATITAAENKPDGLILVAPYYAVTRQWYYILRPETWAGLAAPILHWLYKPQSLSPVNRAEARSEIISYTWVPTRGALTAMLIAEKARRTEILDKITQPTLIIHSENDTVTDPNYANSVYERIPAKDKTIHWLTLSDHIPFYDYERELVKIQVNTFLNHWTH